MYSSEPWHIPKKRDHKKGFKTPFKNESSVEKLPNISGNKAMNINILRKNQEKHNELVSSKRKYKVTKYDRNSKDRILPCHSSLHHVPELYQTNNNTSMESSPYVTI